MKTFRSTGFMFLVVAALAAYTFYEYKNSSEDAEVARGDHRLFQMVRDDIETIEIQTPEGLVNLAKTDKGWQMKKPVDDVADSSAVEGFVYSMLTQKGKDFRAKEDGTIAWSKYGLDPVTRQVEIRGHGKDEKLIVSSTHAFDGSYYIRQGDNLWLGDRGLAQIVERDAKSFRSRKIYRGPEDVKTIRVTEERGSYTFQKGPEKDKNVWTMEPSPKFAIDSAKVTVWAQKVDGLLATEIVEDEYKPEKAAQYFLKKPSMTLELGGETLTLGQDHDGEVFVTSTARPSTVYKVPVNSLDPIRVPRSYFRDGQKPFLLDIEQVREIEWHGPKGRDVYQKKDDKWILTSAKDKKEVDEKKLSSWLSHVRGLEAREFLSQAGPGLPSNPQLTFKGAGGKILLSLAWGGDYKSPFAFNRGLKLEFVKASGTADILAVAKDKLDSLVDAAKVEAH